MEAAEWTVLERAVAALHVGDASVCRQRRVEAGRQSKSWQSWTDGLAGRLPIAAAVFGSEGRQSANGRLQNSRPLTTIDDTHLF
jgi:hypothetical protein